MATSEATPAPQRRYWRQRKRAAADSVAAAAPPTTGHAIDWRSLQISAAVCAAVMTAFLASDPYLLHWFAIPVYLCGVVIGVDAIQWTTGRRTLLDPIGIVGVVGLHFFFLAPLLHVTLNWY